jgi:hypothetical protein
MNDALLFSIAGFAVSLGLFFFGFRSFGKYRLLANIPRSPIRSMAMGLVQIHGKAKSHKTVAAPLTGKQCLFYRVDVRVRLRNEQGRRRSYRLHEADGIPFHCEDKTGKVLVDAHGADLDLIPNFKKTVVRRSEWASMGSGLRSVSGDPTMSPSKGVSDYSVVTYVDDLIIQKRAALVGDGIVGKLAQGAVDSQIYSARDCRYDVTEYCVFPEHWYDVTGTCTQNPEPQGPEDRNIIVKGVNNPAFYISWRGEQQFESHLRNVALLEIFGGAFLSLVSMAFFLRVVGWL